VIKRSAILGVVLALLACCAQGVTWTHGVGTASTSNSTAHTTATFTVAASDLLVACASVSGVTTGATMTVTDVESLGWSQIAAAAYSSSANSVWCFVANSFATASTTETVTFTSSTSGTGANIVVERLSGMSRTGAGAIRQSAITSNGAASATPAPAFAAAVLTGNPVIGTVGNSTSPATLTPPSTFTEQDDIGYSTPTTGQEAATVATGFTGTTVTWGSTSGSVFGAIIVELDATAIVNPAFVQAASCPTTGSTGGTDYLCQFNEPTAAGNLIVIFGQAGSTGLTGATFTDDVGGNTYTQACTNLDTPNGLFIVAYYVMNNVGGVRQVKLHWSGGSSSFDQFSMYEFANVATAAALDHGVCANATSATVAPGATGTLGTGDLILVWATEDFGGAHITACTPATQANITWTMVEAQTIQTTSQPTCGQYGVYTTTTSFTPTFTMTGATSTNGAMLAFKSSGAGSVPTYASPHVVYAQHDNTFNETAASFTTQMNITGNEFIIGFIAGCSTPNTLSSCSYITSISGGPTGLTQIDSNTALNDSVCQIWEAHNVTPGIYNLTYTMHPRPSGGNGDTFMEYDIAGADTSSPLDPNFGGSGVKAAVATGTDSTSGGAGGTFTSVSGTPGSDNELVVVVVGIANQSCTALSTPATNTILTSATWITEGDPTFYDENNCWGTWTNGTTHTLTAFGWTHDNASGSNGVGAWAGLAVGVRLPGAGGGPAPAINKRKKLEKLEGAYGGMK
jgi:hypothetical protein